MANVKGGVIAAKKAASTPSAKKSMQDLILSMRPQIEAALPSVLTGERFSRMILFSGRNDAGSTARGRTKYPNWTGIPDPLQKSW